ncbi:MAG: nucleotidyltransferase family protein [Gammaproteobacteria bacterium]|nr:nucleotidyltransferase family protein [Gammaproteobacteria bacterium]MDE0414764.1 nucleotidyltransferase family protein [Gammaproteobacteria bacterium]
MTSARNEFRPTRAMILAAGRGRRLRPLSDGLPKALMEVEGKPLIEHLLKDLAVAGVREAVVNLSWLGGMIRSRLGDGLRHGLRIRYSEEGETALDTGGGIRRALPLLGEEPFWVVNADIRTSFPFSVSNRRPRDLAWLMLVPNPAHNPAGDFHLRQERVGSDGPRHTFGGVSVLSPELFRDAGEEVFGLAPLLRAAAAQGRVSGALYEGYWADAGTVERLEAIRRRPPEA